MRRWSNDMKLVTLIQRLRVGYLLLAGMLLVLLPSRGFSLGDIPLHASGGEGSSLKAETDWFNAGCVLVKSNDLVTAELAYRNVIVTSTNCYAALEQLGFLLWRFPARAQDAEAYLRVCVQLQPQRVRAPLLLADLVRRRNGPTNEVEAWYFQSITNNSNYAVSHSELGTFYLEQDQVPLALRELRRAVELAPDIVEHRINLGLALARLPDKQHAAEEEFRRALQLDTNCWSAAQNLALVLSAEKGREDEATKWVRRAMVLKPGKGLSCRILGDILSRDPQRRTEAEQQYLEGLKLDPQAAELRLRLGDLLSHDPKRWGEAREYWKQSLELYRAKTNATDRPFLLFGVTAQDRIEYLERRLKEQTHRIPNK